MTDGIFSTIEDWTGTRPISCPWSAFFDPFVKRVLFAYRFFVEGQVAWASPDPSARLVAGVACYDAAAKACESKRAEQQREESRIRSNAAMTAQPARRRGR